MYIHKSTGRKDKTYTHKHCLTLRQKCSVIITHTRTHTYTHALKQSHKSQSHIPQRAVFTAEKTDWACLFVGSLLHVCLLSFSQWKTSILRIIKWLKRALLIGCVCLPSVYLCACVSVRVNMRKHVSESVFGCVCECSSGRLFGYVLIHP